MTPQKKIIIPCEILKHIKDKLENPSASHLENLLSDAVDGFDYKYKVSNPAYLIGNKYRVCATYLLLTQLGTPYDVEKNDKIYCKYAQQLYEYLQI